jgi:hypothetical protein
MKPATCDAARPASTFTARPAAAARRRVRRPGRWTNAREPGSDSLPETASPASLPLEFTAGLEVREERESYRARPGRRTPADVSADYQQSRRDPGDARDPADPGDDDLEAWTREADDEADLEPAGAARASMPPLQTAQRHLDDAVNLVGLLLDALEQDADSRAEQARTVLAMTVESLHRARRLVDEQDLRMEESDGEELEDELPPMGD